MGNAFTSDLAATRYSAAAVLMAQYASTLSAQGIVYDGDFSKAQATEFATPSYPFASRGDISTIIVKQRWMQFAANFAATALGTVSPFRSDLLLIEESGFRDEGAGIYSWVRTYANIPQAGDDFGPYSYGFQYLYQEPTTYTFPGSSSSSSASSATSGGSSSGGTLMVAEQVFDVTSRVRSEYFLIKDLANWPISFAPRIVPTGPPGNYQKRGDGDLHVEGNVLVSSDAQILAEDQRITTWKYPIMCRTSRYIAGPTAEFWGAGFPLSLGS